jgi:twinkle protein
MGGTLLRLAGKAVRAVFWDPKVEYDPALFQQGKALIGDNIILYDGYQGVDWGIVKQEIRNAVMVAGCKDVFLDPLTCFTVGMSLTEQNETLISIASEIASMAMELDFTAYLFCHLNAPQGGPAHERGGKVQSVQFSGSRAMMRQRRM